MPTRKSKYCGAITVLLALILMAGAVTSQAATETENPSRPGPEQERQQEMRPGADQAAASRTWALSFGIALAVGLPCLAAGYAVARVGSAALGAASEKPELLTRGLLFVALAEGIAIYGLLIAILLWFLLWQ